MEASKTIPAAVYESPRGFFQKRQEGGNGPLINIGYQMGHA